MILNQYVYRGQHIANADDTGDSDGDHLHFELRVNGTAVNPYPDAWISGSPIPMGFRDQTGTVHGPFALDDTKIHDKWLALNGGPGAPVADDTTNPCFQAGASPRATFRIQRFERGYLQYCGSANADYIAYGKTYLPDTKIAYNNWNSSIAMHADGLSSRVGLYFYKPDGTVADSRVYDSELAPNALWIFDTIGMTANGGEVTNPVDPVAGSGVVAAELNVSAEASNQSSIASAAYIGNQSPATTAYLPNLIVTTTRQAYVSLQNAGTSTAIVSLNFYNRNGGLVHSRTETIPVNGDTTLLLNNIPQIVSGFAVTSNIGSMFASVTNGVPIAVSAQVNYTDQNGAYAYGGVSSGDTTLWTPGVFRRVSGSTWLLYSAVNVQNLNIYATSIRVKFINRSGNVTHSFSDTVQPIQPSPTIPGIRVQRRLTFGIHLSRRWAMIGLAPFRLPAIRPWRVSISTSRRNMARI